MVLLAVTDFDTDADGGCGAELLRNTLGFLVTLCVTVMLEAAVAFVSSRGSISDERPRSAMSYLLYARLGVSSR